MILKAEKTRAETEGEERKFRFVGIDDENAIVPDAEAIGFGIDLEGVPLTGRAGDTGRGSDDVVNRGGVLEVL